MSKASSSSKVRLEDRLFGVLDSYYIIGCSFFRPLAGLGGHTPGDI